MISRDTESVVFGDVIYAPEGVFGPRIQKDFQIFILKSGSATIKIDGHEHHIQAGQMVLLKPRHREMFYFSKSHSTHHQWCAVSPALITSDVEGMLKNVAMIQAITGAMVSIIEVGLAASSSNSFVQRNFLNQLGLCALHAFAVANGGQAEKVCLHDALKKARAFVHANLASSLLDVSGVARAAGVSSSHLMHLFKKHLGVTPSRYVWSTRIERAEERLRHTGLSIGEIADQVGFQNPFHLSRLFKKKYGCSPRDYRRQSWASLDQKGG